MAPGKKTALGRRILEGGYFASTVGKCGNEHTITNYVKQQGYDSHTLHEDRQLMLF